MADAIQTNTDTQDNTKRPEIRIVVLPYGWVLLGEYEWVDAHTRIMRRGWTVRRWGTNAGLGQLAAEGPREETQLDAQRDTQWSASAEIFTILCPPEIWGPVIDVFER